MKKSRIVIIAYQPRPGKEQELENLMKDHVPLLRSEGLATDRSAIIMRAGDGSFVEVFEWRSKEAIESAHGNERVQAMWAAFAETCEYIPVSRIKESSDLFSEFNPIN